VVFPEVLGHRERGRRGKPRPRSRKRSKAAETTGNGITDDSQAKAALPQRQPVCLYLRVIECGARVSDVGSCSQLSPIESNSADGQGLSAFEKSRLLLIHEDACQKLKRTATWMSRGPPPPRYGFCAPTSGVTVTGRKPEPRPVAGSMPLDVQSTMKLGNTGLEKLG